MSNILGSELINAIIKSDLQLSKNIYNKSNKEILTLKNNNKRTPLTVACAVGSLEIAKWLYYNGAHTDLYEKDKSLYGPLFVAIREGHVDILKWLYEVDGFKDIKDGDYINQKPLWFICNHTYINIENRLAMAKFFFEKEIITGDSGNDKNDIVYNDILNYMHNNEFKIKFCNWIYNKIHEYDILQLFLKGSIYKKSKNIYKLDNLIKNLIFEYTGILYGNKLKSYKFILEKIKL